MSRQGAAEIAQTRVARTHQSSTVTRSEEVKAQTPSGKDAWLVRVIFDGESGNVCVYVWRDKRVGKWMGPVVTGISDVDCLARSRMRSASTIRFAVSRAVSRNAALERTQRT